MLLIKTSESFENIVKTVSSKVPYTIVRKGRRKYLRHRKEKLAQFWPGVPIPELQSKEAKKLMKNVMGSVTRYIKRVDFAVPEIKKEYPVVFTNWLFWQSIPDGTAFYIIDAKHCYWRIAYLHGYIGEKLYKKYADEKHLKQAKNISLAILNTSVKGTYYVNNQPVHEIDCYTDLHSRVYNNIRYTSYNLCGRLRNDLDDSCFAYRTDGVFLLKPGLARAKKIFLKNNMLYKIEKCVKIDNKTYSTSDGELKKLT